MWYLNFLRNLRTLAMPKKRVICTLHIKTTGKWVKDKDEKYTKLKKGKNGYSKF